VSELTNPTPVPLEFDADSGEITHRTAVVAMVCGVDDFPCLDPEEVDCDRIQEEVNATGNALVARYNAHDELLAKVAKLQAFKDYVHNRLDAVGVSADPDSPHKAEGCRIGGRLDEVFAERNLMLAALRAIVAPGSGAAMHQGAWSLVRGAISAVDDKPWLE
jgi:hypothetical protein